MPDEQERAVAEPQPYTISLAGDEARMARALADIAYERIRQHEQWGVQRHDFPVWLTVLMEEVGELAQATLVYRERAGCPAAQRVTLEEAMRVEAVQVAAVAVAVAMIEHIDEVLDV